MPLVKSHGAIKPAALPANHPDCYVTPPAEVDELVPTFTKIEPSPIQRLQSEAYVRNSQDGELSTAQTDPATVTALTYMSGATITCTYYHRLNGDAWNRSFFSDFSLSLDNTHYSFLKITDFQFKSRDNFDYSYEAENTTSQLTGTGVTYPWFEPAIGDIFLYRMGDGRQGVFQLHDQPRRTSVRNLACHEINYTMLQYLDQELLSKLESCVADTAQFNLKRYLTDQGALLTSGESALLTEAQQQIYTLTACYVDEFYDRQIYHSFVDDPHKFYDPYLVEFTHWLFETDELPGYAQQLRPNPRHQRLSFWQRLLHPELIPETAVVRKCRRHIDTINFRTTHITALANRPYLELDPHGDQYYPPFRVPETYDSKDYTVPMQVTLYLRQRQLRPAVLRALSSEILTMCREAKFYYIPILIFFWKQLLQQLQQGNAGISFDQAEIVTGQELLSGCDNCIYWRTIEAAPNHSEIVYPTEEPKADVHPCQCVAGGLGYSVLPCGSCHQ